MEDVIKSAPLFLALDEEASYALRASMVEIDLLRGETLFTEGDPGDRLYVIIDGKIKLGTTSNDGRESLLAVLGPGEMFGELSLFDPGPRTATATALTETNVLGLGHEALGPWLTGRPEVAKALVDLGEKFGVKQQDGLYVEHDLTQEELAQLVGASRETVNKALADFVQREWIKLEPRAVLLIDSERLNKRAR